MNSESSRVAKVPNATFEKHQEAKLNEILNSQMNEKKNKRQQTLITNFIRKENDRHEATQQAFMNENISDEDSDDDVLPDHVFDDDNDACSFEGWEYEEIEALRIDQQAREKQGEHDSSPPDLGPSSPF